MQHSIYLLFIFLIPVLGYAQGLPFIKSYTPNDYQNSRQNWDITQDSSGYLYFGNAAGLLQFDGKRWYSIHIPNLIVRSTYTTTDGRIYVGGRGEFGFLTADSLSRISYQSISSRLDSSRQHFTDVWDISEYEGSIYFRTRENIFKWADKEITTIEADAPIGKLEHVGDKLFVWLFGEGLSVLNGQSLKFVNGSEEYSTDRLYAILPFGNGYLLCFRESGLVTYDGYTFQAFDSPASDYIKKYQVYKAEVINPAQFALATLTGGIIVADMKGNIDHVITEEFGLNTNIVYSLYTDREKNLWAALDNGLARIDINNPVTRFDEMKGLKGVITGVEETGGKIYIATTEGLYRLNDNRSGFQKIMLPINRIYDLSRGSDYILAAGDERIFKIREDSEQLVLNLTVNHLAVDHSKENTFWGISSHTIYKIYHEDGVESVSRIAELEYALHSILEKDNNLWVLTRSNEILQLDKEGGILNQYTLDLDESAKNEFFDIISGEIMIGTGDGLFRFDSFANSFVRDSTFDDEDILSKQVFTFRQCSDEEIWFRANRSIKRAVLEGDQWNISVSPYRLIGEDEAVNDIFCDNGTAWFAGNAGLYHLSDPNWDYDYDFKTNITGLLVKNDSLIYGGFGNIDYPPQLSYDDNELRFTFAAASYIAPEENSYRVRLRGYDEGWSNWTSETEKDYTFIPEGAYTFEVQGRNVYHKAGTIDSFTFSILPPWYRTIWAYIGYVMLISGMFFGLHKLRLNRILREQRIRNRIASDLHDEVSATLSSITYFAQAIRQLHDGKKSGRFVELISESASEAKEKITDIIWSIDPENDDWVNLLSKCHRFASDLFESKGIEYDLDIATDIHQPLDLELRQHLWLIFKEMVVNAARHSGASKVEIYFGMNSPNLVLKVQDNGCGIDEERSKSGHGLKNIRKRAAEIGADISLESDPEIGTRWVMSSKI